LKEAVERMSFKLVGSRFHAQVKSQC